MTKFGQVSAYNEKTGVATIVYIRPDACEKCGACGTKSHTGSIELKADCRVGDWVRVELPNGRFIHATALAYVLPLCGFLGGLFAGNALSGGNEGFTLLGSAIGLGLCILALRIVDKHITGKAEWTPRVLQVYAEKPDMDVIGCGGQGL